MFENHRSQAGFSVVEVLLAVVVVLVLGGSAYLVYHSHHKKPAESTSTVESQSTKPTQKTSSSTSKPSTPATTYFTIKEWGVQAPYSGSDLSYSTASDSSSIMTLESQAVDATIPASDTSASCKSGNAGSIGRYLPTNTIPGPSQATAQTYITQSSDAVYSKVGSYYYIYWPPTAGCSTDTTPVTQAQAAAESIVSHLVSTPQ